MLISTAKHLLFGQSVSWGCNVLENDTKVHPAQALLLGLQPDEVSLTWGIRITKVKLIVIKFYWKRFSSAIFIARNKNLKECNMLLEAEFLG